METLTFVKVLSIAAEPAVVCAGNLNIAYTITTQPGGFEYMVEYTPADTSLPGVKEVVATCGSSAATCTVTVVGVAIADEYGGPRGAPKIPRLGIFRFFFNNSWKQQQ